MRYVQGLLKIKGLLVRFAVKIENSFTEIYHGPIMYPQHNGDILVRQVL